MSRVQQPTVHSSKPSSRSALSPHLVPSVPRPAARRYAAAPQAFVRGCCSMPFGARRADQQVLDQLFREVMGFDSGGSQPAARDFELPLAVDAADEGSAYVFRADIPGVLRQDLKVLPFFQPLTFCRTCFKHLLFSVGPCLVLQSVCRRVATPRVDIDFKRLTSSACCGSAGLASALFFNTSKIL